jgi:hypothetical protein
MQQRGNGNLLVLKCMVVVLGLTFACGISYVAGRISGEVGAQHQQWEQQKQAVAPILAQDPAFANVEILPYHDGGWILLGGDVQTDFDKARLMREVTQAIGQKKAENAVPGVMVREPLRNLPMPPGK